MKKYSLVLGLAALVLLSGFMLSRELDKHGPNSNAPSKYTLLHNKQVLNDLPFYDSTDFVNAQRGFIATLEEGVIKDSAGRVVYSMKEYDFLMGPTPTTANPSLWRQSYLNNVNGLFELSREDSIYQIRGFDLANMTLIKGKTGWIIIDPLLSQPTAEAGLALVREHIGDFPVSAVILTHSHIDHFGGMRAVVSEEDITSGKIHIYAPENFYDDAVSENTMAGNCMGRRASYMYGNILPKDTTGTLGTGLGTTTSSGMSGILQPDSIITALDGETRIIDGLEVEFIYTPESEAPAEMIFYFPELKTLCQSEDVNHTMHNLYTLRGAKVRNGQKWSQYLDKSIQKWGDEAKLSFGSHHWPTWGNKNIVKLWESQRDLYRYLHDQTLRMANTGMTPKEIAQALELPPSLDTLFYNRGYYGTVSHNAKAQYQLYFGWFDGNPANLNPLQPTDAGKKYVEYMGGARAVISKARKSYAEGEYRWVAEVLNHVVFADPTNTEAKNLLADAYEQMGYQAESGPWRNFYLSGAQELRVGVIDVGGPTSGSPDMIAGISPKLYFNYMGMQFLGTENGDMQYNFNVTLTDLIGTDNEHASLIVRNGVVNSRVGPDSHLPRGVTTANLYVKLSDLKNLSFGAITLDQFMQLARVTGDQQALSKFLSQLQLFEFWFDIVTP